MDVDGQFRRVGLPRDAVLVAFFDHFRALVDGADDELLVVGIERGREEHVDELTSEALVPDLRREDIVKRVDHEVPVLLVQLLALLLPLVLRFQLQHGGVADECLHRPAQTLQRPVWTGPPHPVA